MPELHIARCDAPGCSNEAALNRELVWAHLGSSLGGSVEAAAFSLPVGWRNIDGKSICSWACVAAYAEGRAKEGG